MAFDGSGDRKKAEYEIISVYPDRTHVVVGACSVHGTTASKITLVFNKKPIIWPGKVREAPKGFIVPSQLKVQNGETRRNKPARKALTLIPIILYFRSTLCTKRLLRTWKRRAIRLVVLKSTTESLATKALTIPRLQVRTWEWLFGKEIACLFMYRECFVGRGGWSASQPVLLGLQH